MIKQKSINRRSLIEIDNHGTKFTGYQRVPCAEAMGFQALVFFRKESFQIAR